MTVPHSEAAEWSVIGQILSKPDAIAEVVGSQLAPSDFFRPDCRLIYETAVESYYADERVDAVTVGERIRKPLSGQWGVAEGEVATRLYEQAAARAGADSVKDHANVVKRHSDSRQLLTIMDQARIRIEEGRDQPDQIGDWISTAANDVVKGRGKRAEILSWMEVGREYVRWQRNQIAARAQGIEYGVYTGLKFVDLWTRGIAPGEFMLLAGPPGVGKSALTFEMGRGFAARQLPKPADKRVSTLILCMEMGLVGSSGRMASSLTGIGGDKLREANIDKDELSHIIRAWKANEELPLYWNFASNFKMSQMKALVVEGIRRYNVGYVIIDHFRMFDPDRRINNANQEDEAKARFLKEEIAKDLDVAVLCLAHTVKINREGSDQRPQLNDIRGSGQVTAHCDIAAFMYMPYMHATEDAKDEGIVQPTDAELIFRKNRNGALGTSEFYAEMSTMSIRDA
jgi:replicative DNA helicase